MKTLVILSGGMDSTTLMYHLDNEGDQLQTISFSYGQRHSRELLSAGFLTGELDLEGVCITVDHELLKPSSSALVGGSDVPHGHYAADNMKATVVPNRNMTFLSMALARCIAIGADRVAYAAHAGDHDIYPDCRPDFVNAMTHAANVCDWWENSPPYIDHLHAPFLRKTKADIVSIGRDLGVPFERTWSCYEGGEIHCGRCGTCVERREAFWLAGVDDPTEYACDEAETRRLLEAR